MLPFGVEYPPEQTHGYWGPPTLTIDWCEENYVVLNYVAEALNTITNAMFVAVAGFAIHMARKNMLENRFILTALGFMLVGVGLWWFHMTLRYEYQLLDELPMIYATCIPFWSVYTEFRTQRQAVLIAIAVAIGASLLTLIYLYFGDPTIHQVSYAFLNFGLIFQSIMLTRTHVANSAARRQVYQSMWAGIAIFGVGFAFWNADVHLCDAARRTRREWGMPYGFILEGHAWWHIFTSFGIYYFLISQQYIRCLVKGTAKFYSFRWRGLWPELSCTDREGLRRHRAVQKLAELDAQHKKNA